MKCAICFGEIEFLSGDICRGTIILNQAEGAELQCTTLGEVKHYGHTNTHTKQKIKTEDTLTSCMDAKAGRVVQLYRIWRDGKYIIIERKLLLLQYKYTIL